MPFSRNSSPRGKQSDSGPLARRNKGGQGLLVLANDEIEMESADAKALEVVRDV